MVGRSCSAALDFGDLQAMFQTSTVRAPEVEAQPQVRGRVGCVEEGGMWGREACGGEAGGGRRGGNDVGGMEGLVEEGV